MPELTAIDSISDSPMLSWFPPHSARNCPPVMPATVCNSTSCEWWPGTDRFEKRIRTARLPGGRGSAQADGRHPHQLEHTVLAGLDFRTSDAPALLDYNDVPALLRKPERGRGTAEARADDQVVAIKHGRALPGKFTARVGRAGSCDRQAHG